MILTLTDQATRHMQAATHMIMMLMDWKRFLLFRKVAKAKPAAPDCITGATLSVRYRALQPRGALR